MVSLREAAQQALEVLEDMDSDDPELNQEWLGKQAITALRAALAEPAAPTVVEANLFNADITPRPLQYPLSDYHNAMSSGPLNYTWQDKPHRLVYDLIAALMYYTAPSPQKPGFRAAIRARGQG